MEHVLPNRSSGRISLGFWGWMSDSGPGELIQVSPPRFNAHAYVRLLEEVMLPTVRALYPEDEHEEVVFVQDNCSIHTAHIVRDWFEDNPSIRLLNWPSKSPDLNPIENLWGQMVLNWQDPFYGVRNRAPDLLRGEAIAVWERMRGRELCQNMVAGMRNRLQECIDANGYHTSY
jgi:hypothetical protein